MIVSHNLTAMNANRQFNINRKDKEKLTEKLSSGYRINRSADDAAGLAISEKMRRQIRGLDRAAENIKDGISLCNVADGALNEIHDIMQRQRQLLIQAGNDTNSDSDKEYIQQEITQLSEEFDRIFDTTDFNTILIFKGKDTVMEGPESNQKVVGPTEDIKTENEHISTNLVWYPSGTKPTDTSDTTTRTWRTMNTKYYDTETMLPPDEDGHSPYQVSNVTEKIDKDYTEDTTISTKYTPVTDADYIKRLTTLNTPKQSINASSGYLSSIRNMEGNLNLSCAMSQLGIKIDDSLVSIDLYSSGKSEGTVFEDSGKKATTTYNLGNGIKLEQKVVLEGDDTYKISFAIDNQSGDDHKIDARFAFDVMNSPVTAKNDGSTSFTLNSNFASINVSGDGTSKAMLGSINDLYDDWDATKVKSGEEAGIHAGAGFWWSDNATSGNRLELGSVTYGPIAIGDPYYENVDKEVKTTIETTRTIDSVDTTIMPTYLDIQSGTEKGQKIPIRLWNLSSGTLHMEPEKEVSVHNIEDSLDNIDNAFEKVNYIRSYYGAMTNRLERAYNVNRNSEENTQAAESVIRDTDMAKTMVEYSNHNILEQAGNSMLAQANQSNRDVLSLLG